MVKRKEPNNTPVTSSKKAKLTKPPKPKDVIEVIDGELVRIRKGLPRTNKPVTLPETTTWLKQPNILTLMSADFKSVQLKAFIAIVERFQSSIEESIRLHDRNGDRETEYGQLSLFQEQPNNITVHLSFKDLGVAPEQYNIVKSVLRSMVQTPVEFDTVNPETGEAQWTVQGLIAKAHISTKKYTRSCSVEIDRQVAKLFVNVDKGFTRYIKEIAFRSQSKYTIRMYMLISSWKDRGGFSIYVDKFRKFLRLQDKYPQYKDLYRWVIRPVYEDLFEKSNCWFEVAEVYRGNEPEPYKLNFKIVKANLTRKEQEALNTQRRAISSMCTRYFQMNDAQLSKLLPLVSVENSAKVQQKILYLHDYCIDHWQNITSISDYCLQALLKDFGYVPGCIDDEVYGTDLSEDEAHKEDDAHKAE